MKINRKIRFIILVLIDMGVVFFSYLFTMYIKYGRLMGTFEAIKYSGKFLLVTSVLYIIAMLIFRVYKMAFRNAGFEEFIKIAGATFLGATFNIAYVKVIGVDLPIIVNFVAQLFIFIILVEIRISFRVYRNFKSFGKNIFKKDRERVLIIGAGFCGNLLIEEIKRDNMSDREVIGIIDDNGEKENTYIKGIKIYGGREKIETIVKEQRIDLILIAIANLSAYDKRNIVKICNETKVKVKIIPSITAFIDSKKGIEVMRDIDLHDLLGRDEIMLDETGIKEYIENEVILVTGGGGSIGSELCRQIAKNNPKLLLVLDIYENSVYDIQNELKETYKDLKYYAIIVSVTDKKMMRSIFEKYKPTVVFHAAAHKHVPLMEFSPLEAVQNNIGGTLNVASLSYEYNIKRFVLISTDKAVNPTNVMGATKRYCEMIVQALHKKAKDNKSASEFVAVRFGNVLGSNGSVIPLFKKQIETGGEITLTHREITRYFMLIPEAVRLVLQAGGFAKGGEIFVLDMGEPVKIYDLAENLIKLSGLEPNVDIKIKEVGLRPGEKLYEELLMDEEGLTETSNNKIFIAKPSEYDLYKLKANYFELISVGEKYGDEELKNKLQEYVPTYTRAKKQNIVS